MAAGPLAWHPLLDKVWNLAIFTQYDKKKGISLVRSSQKFARLLPPYVSNNTQSFVDLWPVEESATLNTKQFSFSTSYKLKFLLGISIDRLLTPQESLGNYVGKNVGFKLCRLWTTLLGRTSNYGFYLLLALFYWNIAKM